MAIIQVGLKSCVLPRRKRWYRSFCRTRLLLARIAQNVAKNRAKCWRTGGKVLCWGTGGGTLLGRPSSNTEYSARPPTRSTIFGHVLASPGQLEPSSAKWLSPSFLSRQNTTFKPNLSNCQWIPLKFWIFNVHSSHSIHISHVNDPWDMLNNFCFHVYAQKSLFMIVCHAVMSCFHAVICWSVYVDHWDMLNNFCFYV